MQFRVLEHDELIPNRPKLPGRKSNPELDKIASLLRAGERIEIKINPAKGAKRQVTYLRSSLAYRGLAVSVRTTDKNIYLTFTREVARRKIA